MSKLRILVRCLWGYILKYCFDLSLLNIPSLGDKNQANVIVSLTSYGRRVEKCVVYYTICSLLRQNIQPKRIILWLAENEWSDEKLPARLLRLKSKGLEIMYYKDIRSYKKLIPTLKFYPNQDILTVDDDMMYSADTVQALVEEHKRYPKDIICLNASKPIIENGYPSHYEKWESYKDYKSGNLVFPIGVGGIYYPHGSLHSDVMREDLFMQLCPLADDIWFWFNGLRAGTIKRFILKSKKNYSFDDLYQYFHRGSALTHTNCQGHQNNSQFASIFEHYKVFISEHKTLAHRNK